MRRPDALQEAQALERLLAALATDAPILDRFLADPEEEAQRWHCRKALARGLHAPDAVGLRLAFQGFEQKRARQGIRRRRWFPWF